MRILLIIIMAGLITSAVRGQNYQEVSKRPVDSVNAEQMRIWIPVEEFQAVVTVTVFDHNMNLIRTLLSPTVMKKGYHNIYWDKKNDAGYYVNEGRYWYELTKGKEVKREFVTVSYRFGENALLLADYSKDSMIVSFEILQDSTSLTVEIYDIRNRLKERPIVDSLFDKGTYTWRWIPSDSVYYGKFTATFMSGEFKQFQKMVYKRK